MRKWSVYNFNDFFIDDPYESLCSSLSRALDVSGNEVRRLIKAKAVRLRLYTEDTGTDLIDNEVEPVGEFATRLLYVGKRTAVFIKNR